MTLDLAALKRTVRHCRWTHDEYHDYWHTGCGQDWCFEDGGPKENGVRYCYHCGKPVRVIGKDAQEREAESR